ncbi:MAG: sulfatase/phosphatase domain-containing protein, partial [Bacteroidota bacterium]
AWDAHYDKVNKYDKEKNLTGKDLELWKYQRYIKDYLRCVVSVDNNVGRVLDYLADNGLEENTLVIYTSDQGFYLGEHGWYDKRFMYEESFSTPLAIRYPAAISKGQTTDALALNLDFAPTILDYAGVDIPDEIQGTSLRPLCSDSQPDDWRQSVYYHYYQSTGWHHVPKHYGVRTDRYKLLHYYEKGDWELYDLESDPQEMNNLYNQANYAPIVEDLKEEIKALQEKYAVKEHAVL